MKIHEYQGKAILREFGVPVPSGDVADSPEQAKAIAARLGGRVVVKAQVHAGGRGKAGGVKLAEDPAGAEAAARQILGMMLKTPQTPPEGIKVLKVLVEEASPIDTKLNFDDNALYRHKEIVALRDINEETPLDVEASKYGLNYIKLDGNVGCMVNGAGLAMATMDIIKLAGGEPANFLDVGGGASPEQIENAFRILSSDPSVKAVFINVFGGILRVDRLAAGLIAAAKKLGLRLPGVVRMEGTNVELGKKMLAESGLRFVTASDMGDGARKVVALAKGSR